MGTSQHNVLRPSINQPMRPTEAKSTHSQRPAKVDRTFFEQKEESAFFFASTPAQTTFFQARDSPTIQAKSASNPYSFFQPTRMPNIQSKYAACEAEEKQKEAQGDLPAVQRMPAFGSDDEGEAERVIQRMPAFERDEVPVQAKLMVGQPGDAYEQEADQVADRVMRMPEPSEQEAQKEEIKLRPLPISRVQRQCAACAVEEKQETLQRQEEGAAALVAKPRLETRLTASKGNGQPLPKGTRGFMESRFGQDFSAVRVHTGSESVQMNQDLGAQAFTHQQDVYFGAGKYSPESEQGKRLLAYELTHTVQQGKTGAGSERGDTLDRADRLSGYPHAIVPCDLPSGRASPSPSMSSPLSIAASLSPGIRQEIGIQVLSRSQSISHLAATHQVSRKFVYQQGGKAQQAIDESFAPSQGDDEVLFHLPVTKELAVPVDSGLSVHLPQFVSWHR